MTDEVRVVDPQTGGAKGSKLARFDLVPPDVMLELAEHYGKGSLKYDDRNWEKGYDWGLSVAALERHLNAWKRGEDFDEETGSSHLVAVIWHAVALRWFQLHDKGKDFRQVSPGAKLADLVGNMGWPRWHVGQTVKGCDYSELPVGTVVRNMHNNAIELTKVTHAWRSSATPDVLFESRELAPTGRTIVSLP